MNLLFSFVSYSISIDCFDFRMIILCSIWEEFRMVDIRSWVNLFSIWEDCWYDINVIEWFFTKLTQSKSHNSLTLSMDCLVFASNHILPRFPFKSSLSGNDISWHHLLTSKLLQSISISMVPKPTPCRISIILSGRCLHFRCKIFDRGEDTVIMICDDSLVNNVHI